MRKLIYFLVLLGSIKTLASSLLESRGFKSNLCFHHSAKLRCQKAKNTCTLVLFPHSSGELQIQAIVKANEKYIINKYPENYFDIEFEMTSIKNENIVATIKSVFPIEKELFDWNKNEKTFLAHSISCR